jgi:metal-responsive CopG/Arc/MetJ family transcriptional regulator
MSSQVVVRMPDRLVREVDEAAKRMARRRSDVVRLAVEQWVAVHANGNGRAARERAKRLIGSVDTGVPDLARRHREYLIESLRRAR